MAGSGGYAEVARAEDRRVHDDEEACEVLQTPSESVVASSASSMVASWLRLGLFCLLTGSNAFQWIVYSSIPDATQSAYRPMTTSQLDSLSTVYMIVFVACSVLASVMVDRYSLTTALLAGSGCTAAGALFKWLQCAACASTSSCGFLSFWWLFSFQFVASLGQVFLLSAPPLVAESWFPLPMRGRVTAMASMANNVGSALGLLLPPRLVPQGGAAAIGDWVLLYTLQGVCSLVPLVGFAISSRMSPRVPQPNHVITQPSQHSLRTLPLWRVLTGWWLPGVVTLIKDKGGCSGFAAVWISFSLSVGCVWTAATFMAQIMQPFGISNSDAGIMSFLNLIAGSIVGCVLGKIVEVRRKYKTAIIACNAVGALCLTGMYFILSAAGGHRGASASGDVVIALTCVYTLAGAALNAVIPLNFELSMELTFAENDSLSSIAGGLLMSGANAVALAAVSFGSSTAVLGDDAATSSSYGDSGGGSDMREKGRIVLTMLIAMLCVGTLCMLPVREVLRRP